MYVRRLALGLTLATALAVAGCQSPQVGVPTDGSAGSVATPAGSIDLSAVIAGTKAACGFKPFAVNVATLANKLFGNGALGIGIDAADQLVSAICDTVNASVDSGKLKVTRHPSVVVEGVKISGQFVR